MTRRSHPRWRYVAASMGERRKVEQEAAAVRRTLRLAAKTGVQHVKPTEIRLGCGKMPAYPQDGMCRKPVL